MNTVAQEPKIGKGLSIISTPIGNMGDITVRAVEWLRHADKIACEDTRITGKLLAYHGIATPMIAYHEHNAEHVRPKLLQLMQDGGALALVSDAGTPLISDPGYNLVNACYQADIPVTAAPGVCAPIMALTLSGLPSHSFTFAGFPPSKSAARKTFYADWQGASGTLIFFESAKRLQASLNDAFESLGDCDAVIARELTKKFEEVIRGKLSDLIENYRDLKGEIVLLLAPQKNQASLGSSEVQALVQALKPHYPSKEVASLVAAATGLSKRDLYQMVIANE
ncbi:MAG: 16S rRNA (cytidine(1402)-2'-O)-methyltransferase [Alphaproteobacteria bacterium]